MNISEDITIEKSNKTLIKYIYSDKILKYLYLDLI